MCRDSTRNGWRALVAILVVGFAPGLLAAQTLTFEMTGLPIPEPLYAVAAGDFDGDGFADLVVGYGSTLRLYPGPGPGPAFTSVAVPAPLVSNWNINRNVAVADFDGDGLDDLAVGYPLASITTTSDGAVQVFHGPNLALGSQLHSPVPATNGVFGGDVEAADLDGDGIPDLFARDWLGVHTFLGPTLAAGPAVTALALAFIQAGDVNGDGLADLIGNTTNGWVAIPGPALDPLGAVMFAPPGSFWVLKVAEFTGDGYEDVVGLGNSLSLFLGPGLTQVSVPLPPGSIGPYVLAVECDLNGDGIADLLASGVPSVYPSNGGLVLFYPPYTVLTSSPEVLNGYGYPLFGSVLAAGDFDADGFEDVATGGLPNNTWPPIESVARLFKAKTLLASSTMLSLGSGGTVGLTIRASVAHAGRTYLILGSASGTYPGIPLGNLRVPIQVDGFTLDVLAQVNGPLFPGFLGTLDADGEATASIVVPAGMFTDPSLIGAQLHFADVVLNAASSAIQVTSNPVTITLAP